MDVGYVPIFSHSVIKSTAHDPSFICQVSLRMGRSDRNRKLSLKRGEKGRKKALEASMKAVKIKEEKDNGSAH